MTDLRIPRPQNGRWPPHGPLDGAPPRPEGRAPLLGAITDGTVHGMLPERTLRRIAFGGAGEPAAVGDRLGGQPPVLFGITRTGDAERLSTFWLTEPRRSPVKPPRPRVPTATSDAVLVASDNTPAAVPSKNFQ